MTDLVVRANFTDGGGTPATGLTLAEISFFLTAQNKSTGALTVVWDGTQNPTVEITNLGAYTRILATADFNTNVYHFMAQYTGATVLDATFVFGSTGQVEANTMQIESADATDQVRDSILTDATRFAGANVDAAISTRATPAQVNAEVVDALATDTYAEPGSVPAATASLAAKIGWLMALARNKILQTATLQSLRNDADSGNIATAAVSDDGVTATRDEWA